MPHLYVEENYVNATNNSQFGEDGPFETFTDDIGRLYHHLVGEYGTARKVYVDSKTLGPALHVGWTFTKRMKYEDTDETYLREVWVTVYEVCDSEDPRALDWNFGKPDSLDENESLRTLDVEAALRARKNAARRTKVSA